MAVTVESEGDGSLEREGDGSREGEGDGSAKMSEAVRARIA